MISVLLIYCLYNQFFHLFCSDADIRLSRETSDRKCQISKCQYTFFLLKYFFLNLFQHHIYNEIVHLYTVLIFFRGLQIYAHMSLAHNLLPCNLVVWKDNVKLIIKYIFEQIVCIACHSSSRSVCQKCVIMKSFPLH